MTLGTSGKALWSGRFRKQLDPSAGRFSSSPEDALMFSHDVAGSIAHAMGLLRSGLLTESEASGMISGLRGIYSSYSARPEQLLRGEEDVHMAVEGRLTRINPDWGQKLHTGRSRNDQVALDMRLYAREAVVELIASLLEMQQALLSSARRHLTAVIPGYTHLQRAQQIYLSHHLLAHFRRFGRDVERLEQCFSRINVSPLGAGAIAGSSHPLLPSYTASLLGFDSPFSNSLDATTDRDFCLDAAYCASVVALHLSSLAEEIVLWSTSEFGYVTLPDTLSTGSSIMPHKKNPDIAELVRGKSGAIAGRLMSMEITEKGLPLGYARDLQEMKEPLFTSLSSTVEMVDLTAAMVREMVFNRDRMAENASDSMSSSVEIVDELVRRGHPFREAHRIVGEAVAAAVESGESLTDVIGREMPDLPVPGNARASVEARSSPGGSSAGSVRKQLSAASSELRSSRSWLRTAQRKCTAVSRLLQG